MNEGKTSLEETGADVDAVGRQLLLKIGNKTQATTFLAGLASAVLAIQLNIILAVTTEPPLLPPSMILMFGALVTFVYCSRRLDSLTMPKMFWGKAPRLTKQPDGTNYAALEVVPFELGDAVVLWERMTLHWKYLNGSASILAAFALLTMIIPPLVGWTPDDKVARYSTIISIVAPVLYLLWFRGFKDRRPLSID